MPGKIVKLPDAVANQIAAGEVVERPVAIVKELVENSLDAGATSIEIQFEKGGKSLVRVLDDGSGMSRDDASVALERHATSKIREVQDILDIGSFGFRGEALPSIASVSRFCLRTRRTEDTEGTELLVDGGASPVVKSCGMSPGTEVVVSHLFHNVPARRKFLKTDRTESAHILQMCRLLAVAHPDVAFSLIEDGREVFRTPACPDRLQRVREIFGRRRADDLLAIDFESNGLHVTGLVGRPDVGRSTRAEMITYVNDRPVDSRLLSYALIESYHRYLPRGRYPAAFLFVNVPAGEVDVNVHPTKREVRFRAESLVRSAVMTGLAEILGKESRKRFKPVEGDSGENAGTVEGAKTILPEPAIIPDRPVPRKSVFEQPSKPITSAKHNLPGKSSSEPELPSPAQRPASSVQRPSNWTYCGSYRLNVGIFESPDGLILLNCRAARERILFEQIEKQFQDETVSRQALLIPAMLELPPLEGSLLLEQLDFFRSIGFEIEPFGRHMFRIREVPGWMQGESAVAFIEDLIGKIRERGIRPRELQPAQALVARIAAANEARGFTVNGEQQWMGLLQQLLACENPLLDARGRPTFVEMRHGEIARKLMLDRLGDESNRLD